MDLDRLKEASHVQWRPPSMVIPACNPKDGSSNIAIDLLQWMNKIPECDDGRRRKDERLHVKNTIKTGNQLANFMNDVCFKAVGFRVRVGCNKLQENEPHVTLKCCRGVHQRTSLSVCNETSSVLPQKDVKCFWSLTLRYDR